MTLYFVKGKLSVKLYCDCPNCEGDEFADGETVGKEIEAESPQAAIAKGIKDIIERMVHDDISVKWAEVTATEVGTDVLLQRLGTAPLFPL